MMRCAMWLIVCCLAIIQDATSPAMAEPARAEKQLAVRPDAEIPLQQSLSVGRAVEIPDSKTTLILIRTSLVALHQAIVTGNFTLLRDLGSPTFRQANTAAALSAALAAFIRSNVDLSEVVVMSPKLDAEPELTTLGELKLIGSFPTAMPVAFQLLYQESGGRWVLHGMSVAVVENVARVPERK